MKTIFLTVVGSQSYGLATPESDIDVKGIAIPNIDAKFGFYGKFDQKDKWSDDNTLITNTNREFCQEVESNPPKDRVVYDLAKFIKLAADCNPNIIETLFTEERFHLIKTPIFDNLYAIRDEFISNKCFHSFQGYALSQLSRIKTAKKWLDAPPTHQPQRTEFGLPSEQKLLDTSTNGAFNKLFSEMLEVSGMKHERKEFITEVMGGEVDWLAMVQKLSNRKPEVFDLLNEDVAEVMNLKPQMIKLISQEKRYNAALKEWRDYNNWVKNRNPKRAKLEKEYGYDSKHAMHLCRLILMCSEILKGEGVQVYRKNDGEFLRAVRGGMFTYEDLVNWAELHRTDLKESFKTTSLPKIPNMKLLQRTCIKMYQEAYG